MKEDHRLGPHTLLLTGFRNCSGLLGLRLYLVGEILGIIPEYKWRIYSHANYMHMDVFPSTATTIATTKLILADTEVAVLLACTDLNISTDT